ncbi:hypothetical protein CRG98_035424 [Punica granatum]|uniref:RanBP2-type domain-containing protein n=1 Tax=Punica granatum TaxID=22663 RepID=A0A2I0IJK9_PUNGR|nr:hypothetical protein CRG98_035424 [Punica granatum]
MSASKLLLAGTGLLRVHKDLTFLPLIPLPKPSFSQSIRFRGVCSSVAVESVAADNSELSQQLPPLLHPWPEWVTFVDRLKTNGYLIESPVKEDGTDGAGDFIYREMNLLKDPCLSFARDRYDLFNSLSSEDIQAVVEVGCPNILRKVVNSAKRLRAHLELEEGDVCGSCNLRGSCDRAYVVPKDSEPPRTVDVVRLLMFYAMDPLVISGGEKPPSRELAESCVRKLISKLVELSESTPSPPPPKQTARAPLPEKKAVENFSDNVSNDIKMQSGDWTCTNCNFLNFKKNRQCLKCRVDRPVNVGVQMKDGDWVCSKCNFVNFARNRRCRECSADGPVREGDNVEMKNGDWNCLQCNFMNFARNKMCKSCRAPRPVRQLNPGEWECPSCDFLNFRKNEACRKCKSKRPRQDEREYEEQLWRSPY